MIVKVLAYKDTKLNIFTNPIYMSASSNEDVIETIRRMCANPQLPKQYFEYDLYLLGEFNDKVGEFDCHQPEFLVSLADYRHLMSNEEINDNVIN